jgi:hypothetical protein
MIDIQRIDVIATGLRSLVETRWPEWSAVARPNHHEPPPSGTCAETAVLLREVLSRRVPEIAWHVTGGETDFCDPTSRGGMVRAGHYNPMAHSWVLGIAAGGAAVIVDVTADQFGHPKVIVAAADDRRYAQSYGLDATPDPAKWMSARIGLAWAADYEREARGIAVAGSNVMSRLIIAQELTRKQTLEKPAMTNAKTSRRDPGMAR